MGAGMNQKQISSRIYRLLKRKQQELFKAGVNTLYKNFELVFFEGDGITFPYSKVDGGFNISYSVSRASNGETAGFPRIRVVFQGETKVYGWQEPAGTYEQGIEFIKANFKGERHEESPEGN